MFVGRGFHQHFRAHERRDAYDVFIRRNDAHHLAIIAHRLVRNGNSKVRVEAENRVAQLLVEPAHDADDDDKHRHSQGDAGDGYQCDDADERPFRPQIPQRDQEFEWQPRHSPKLNSRCPRVNGGETVAVGAQGGLFPHGRERVTSGVTPATRHTCNCESFVNKFPAGFLTTFALRLTLPRMRNSRFLSAKMLGILCVLLTLSLANLLAANSDSATNDMLPPPTSSSNEALRAY